MFICLTTYRRDPLEVPVVLEAHFAYLDGLYRDGYLVASGPREPRTGGALLFRGGRTAAEVRGVMLRDPLVQEQIVDFELLQFAPSRAYDSALIEQ